METAGAFKKRKEKGKRGLLAMVKRIRKKEMDKKRSKKKRKKMDRKK